MNLSKTTFLLLLPFSLPLAAQTATTQPHHRAAAPAAKKPAEPACPPAIPTPALPPGVPPAEGTMQTQFALRYIDMVQGTGAEAAPGQFLTVQYTGWLATTGEKFDSSLDHGEPFTFPQGSHRVIPGWDQGFAGMKVGGKRRLFVPYQLAYGESGRDPIPPKADLIFDVELLAASDTPPGMPPVPPTPEQPPQPTDPPQAPATAPAR